MSFNELSVIRFGEIRFTFFLSNEMEKYIVNKNHTTFELIPKGSFFYQGILEKLKLPFNKEKNIEIYLTGLTGSDSSVLGENEIDFVEFPDYPIHLSDVLYLIKFGVKVK